MNECYFASLLDDVILHFMNFYCMEGRKNNRYAGRVIHSSCNLAPQNETFNIRLNARKFYFLTCLGSHNSVDIVIGSVYKRMQGAKILTHKIY